MDDWHLLMQRNTQNFTDEYKSQFDVRLAFDNNFVNTYNQERLVSLANGAVIIKALHSSIAAAKLSSDDFGGLPHTLTLCKDARVMLTRNLWTQKGLCNGSMGYVKYIIYAAGTSPPSLPVSVPGSI